MRVDDECNGGRAEAVERRDVSDSPWKRSACGHGSDSTGHSLQEGDGQHSSRCLSSRLEPGARESRGRLSADMKLTLRIDRLCAPGPTMKAIGCSVANRTGDCRLEGATPMMESAQLERRLLVGSPCVTSRGTSGGGLRRTLVATSRRTAQARHLGRRTRVAARTLPSVIDLCADDEREPVTFMSLDAQRSRHD